MSFQNMRTSFLFLALVILFGCNSINPLKNTAKSEPPSQRYLHSLEAADLDKTALGALWMKAGERALSDSINVRLPYSESGYFRGSEPDARSYTFIAREGQVLTVNGSVLPKSSPKIFTDLFVWRNKNWTTIAHGDSALNLTYEFSNRDTCLLRIQPELLVDVYYTIGISLTPVLINPVAGASNKSIGSFYGASRDGGKRRHEGVDIFARKGTPVIAPTDGVVTRVGTGKLGGKVVWLQDFKRGHSYYFAHLDSQAVKRGMKLKQGQMIGTVGNTGNARFTPPHLHFGIYQSGAKDPLSYIQTLDRVAQALPWDTTFHPLAYRVVGKTVNFRNGPGEKHELTDKLMQNTFVRVIAESSQWYRVALPDHRQGFVYKSLVGPITKGKKRKLKKPVTLLASTSGESVPITEIRHPSVEVLATFQNYLFVQTKDGQLGWMLP